MTYREFITKLCGIYTFSKGMIEVYNEAFKGKKEFSDYWKKFVTEYSSSEKIPMPSFWLKEEQTENEETPERQAERELMLEAIRKTEELQKKRIEAKYGKFD